MNEIDNFYTGYARVLHAGMALFGVAAWLTGEFAESGTGSAGYLLHAYLGLSLMAFILLRIAAGMSQTGPLSFSGWSPFSRQQWRFAFQDVGGLARFRMPDRNMHEGIAGITQAFGIAVFGWMAATGSGLFLLGGRHGKVFEFVEELHEVGEALIPAYLALHVASVLMHSIAGHSVWQKMWSIRKRRRR